ncbi:MAG: GDSL-type esterase/lipase family protein [Pirellulales bacterium]
MKTHHLPLSILLALLASTLTRSVVTRADEPAAITLPESDEGLPGVGPIRRYEWFRNLWKERRGAWAARTAADKRALVFLGDSITQGFGDDFQGAFPGAKLANRGISGDTTRGMLLRLADDVLALDPAGVVMLMGTNDLEEGATPEAIAANIKAIIAAIEAKNPRTPIVVCQMFPSATEKKRPAEAIKQVNSLVAAAVKNDPRVRLVDTWTLFAGPHGDAKAEEFPDLLHPNDAGYAKWIAAIRPVLETLDLVPVAADDFQPEAGFEMLFNGRDLTGWGYREQKSQARHLDLDGRQSSPDGRYVAKHGRIVVTTPPEGRRVEQLWTTREFPGNFELRLQFRATPTADSGVFIRAPQLQCRDYLLAGPYKELQHYRPQDWNDLVVTVTNGTAHCTCNGEVLEAALAVPASGPIGLEGDSGQLEYRRLRINKLP